MLIFPSLPPFRLFVCMMLTDRLAEKAAGNRASHKYYGPQLQTPWAVPFGSGGDGDGDDAGYSSPTDEVLQMLADRSAGVYSTQPRGEQAREKELAKAYAHAQQQLRHAPAARMAPPVPSERLFSAHQKRVPVEELQQSYLEPQLQHDWLGETALRDQRHKTPAVQMGRAPGRERVKVVQKGLAQVEGFADPVQPLQELGPGHYAQAERHLTVAEQTAAAGGGKGGKGVPFGKAISRQEQAGPYGEKPEAAVQSLGEALGEGREDLYFDDQLDIDYSRAKDQAQAVSTKQGFKMYIKVRVYLRCTVECGIVVVRYIKVLALHGGVRHSSWLELLQAMLHFLSAVGYECIILDYSVVFNCVCIPY